MDILNNEIMIMIVLVICLLMIGIGSLLIYLTRTLVQHRDFYNKREKWLISAIMAKDFPEFANYVRNIEKTAEDDLKQTKAENDLALNAQKLINAHNETAIPIT